MKTYTVYKPNNSITPARKIRKSQASGGRSGVCPFLPLTPWPATQRRLPWHGERKGRSMTEEQWLTSEEPQPMLEFLRGQTSDRKLRLFACACCRRFWDRLEAASREAVEVAERYADGEVGEAVLQAAHDAAYARYAEKAGVDWDDIWGFVAALECAALAASHSPLDRLFFDGTHRAEVYHDTRLPAQATLVRDILGNPFRPVALDPEWRTDTLRILASQMYQSREFSSMPVLADALQDAGCTDRAILDHCRGPGPHCRGCWAVDLLTGRK
jgi:hypothetical protein